MEAHDQLLPSWNDTPTRHAIVAFVEAATRSGGQGYIPPEERIAVFDNDGTLWCEKPMPIELGFILQRAGIEIETATDGVDALGRIRRGTYSGVILDIMLPGMNGFDLLRAVRADRSLDGLPVIVLTAKGQAIDRQMAEAIGATAFITKPFSNVDLVRRVTELTQQSG